MKKCFQPANADGTCAWENGFSSACDSDPALHRYCYDDCCMQLPLNQCPAARDKVDDWVLNHNRCHLITDRLEDVQRLRSQLELNMDCHCWGPNRQLHLQSNGLNGHLQSLAWSNACIDLFVFPDASENGERRNCFPNLLNLCSLRSSVLSGHGLLPY